MFPQELEEVCQRRVNLLHQTRSRHASKDEGSTFQNDLNVPVQAWGPNKDSNEVVPLPGVRIPQTLKTLLLRVPTQNWTQSVKK